MLTFSSQIHALGTCSDTRFARELSIAFHLSMFASLACSCDFLSLPFLFWGTSSAHCRVNVDRVDLDDVGGSYTVVVCALTKLR
jgi:hypothetical protein